MEHKSKGVMPLVSALMQDLNTPRALTVAILVRNGEWEQACSLRAIPGEYLDTTSGIEKFRRDYQATEFIRKLEGLPIDSVDRRSKAIQQFYEYEEQCARTNLRLDLVLNYPTSDRFETAARNLADRAKTLIKKWLGPIPMTLDPRHGPGATFEAKGSRRAWTLGDKYNSPFVLTAGCSDLADHLVWRPNDNWRENVCSVNPTPWVITEGNRFTTVNKDSLNFRGICIEPGVNVYLQLGVGSAIRQRLLKRAGIDLRNGQQRHSRVVTEASPLGETSTIDLSGASDTVSYQLVKALLPDDWFALLDALRSPKTFIEGKWKKLEKFSSMGNGYTFELETLIFLALMCATCKLPPGDVLVYGDDIIIPRKHSADAIAVLKFFGFIPNERKSFTTGMFLESCGTDSFNGVDVRPYYMKAIPAAPEDWIGVCNGITRRYKRAWNYCLRQIPKHARVFGPCDLGDLLIHTEDQSKWTYKWRNQIRWFRVWRPVNKRGIPLDRFGQRAHLLLALSGVPSTGLIPRDWVSGYKVGWVAWS